MAIPIIDIFAGPGGLGEGFSALTGQSGKKLFKIALSIEKDFHAHQTLTLRSFFRQFEKDSIPKDYYEFLQGKITLDKLYESWPIQSKHAKTEAWCATLGEGEGAIANKEVDKRIDEALKGERDWLLIGGPPCQAYSVVGRVRRQEKVLDEAKDERVSLYKQYLRILAVHNPAVFVMENVKGLLSAETSKSPVFAKILNDLSNPVSAYLADFKRNGRALDCPGYKIYSLVVEPEFDLNGNPVFNHKDFLIEAEKYGIPQTRHRVILLGIRNDIDQVPDILKEEKEVTVSKVLAGLPRLRSMLSKMEDNGDNWKNVINQISNRGLLSGIDREVKEEMLRQLDQIRIPHHGTGSEFVPHEGIGVDYEEKWFLDEKIKGLSNHCSRSHMESDLHRYFFISCFAKAKGHSPMLLDFPASLLPDHKNVFKKDGSITRKFADRFRVQARNKPSKTITSHISQDGHYYIHYDPTQCRSLTVREAARIQTFPDNYHFCGPRTAQFIQVGNAVPPLLANKIAKIVNKIFINANVIV